jgi:hypothetical protein
MKFPQWLLVILSFAIVTLTWVLAENAKGDFVLPAQVVAGLTTGLTILKTVVGLTTDSVKTTLARARVVATLGSAGMLLALVCAACTPTTSAQGAATVQPAVSLIACVLPRVVACATATPPTPWPTCTEQTALACGSDVASIVSIWAAHKQAMALESSAGLRYP